MGGASFRSASLPRRCLPALAWPRGGRAGVCLDPAVPLAGETYAGMRGARLGWRPHRMAAAGRRASRRARELQQRRTWPRAREKRLARLRARDAVRASAVRRLDAVHAQVGGPRRARGLPSEWLVQHRGMLVWCPKSLAVEWSYCLGTPARVCVAEGAVVGVWLRAMRARCSGVRIGRVPGRGRTNVTKIRRNCFDVALFIVSTEL